MSTAVTIHARPGPSPNGSGVLARNVLVELDALRRVYLTKVGRHRRYLASEAADGTVTLTPVGPGSVAAQPIPEAAELPAEPPRGPRPARPGGRGNGVAKDHVRDRILTTVRAAGDGGASAADIVDAVGAARSWVFVILKELVGDEVLAKTSDRKYACTEIGETATQTG